MIKRIIFICIFLPLIVSSQGGLNNEIDWIPLVKAKKYAKKYNKNILIYFFKKDCPYCDEMNKETFNDKQIIELINKNFFPVKLNSRTKDTIAYNNTKYSNQQPVSHGHTWRHDFYYEVAKFKQKNQYRTTTPTVVIFDHNFNKIATFPGKQSKQLLQRRIQKYLN